MNVIGKEASPGKYVLSNELPNLLVLHPDTLLSGSMVSDSFVCLRKSVLDDRVKILHSQNMAALLGNALHELFQYCWVESGKLLIPHMDLHHNSSKDSKLRSLHTPWQRDSMENYCREIVQRKISDIWAIGEREDTLLIGLHEGIDPLIDWWDHFGAMSKVNTGS